MCINEKFNSHFFFPDASVVLFGLLLKPPNGFILYCCRLFVARNGLLITQRNLYAAVSVVYMTAYAVSAPLAGVVRLIYIRWLQESVHVTVAGSVPSVTLEAFCKQAVEEQGELFYYCHIIDVLGCSTRNSPLNDSSSGPAPCPH